MVPRGPKAFLDATADVAMVGNSYGNPVIIARKAKEVSSEAKATDVPSVGAGAAAPTGATATDAALVGSVPADYWEGIVHFLVGELVHSVWPQPPAEASTSTASLATLSSSSQPNAGSPPSTNEAPKGPADADKSKQIELSLCAWTRPLLRISRMSHPS